MTKIALFPPSLAGGGIRTVALNLAYGFAAQGLETDLILINTTGLNLADIPANVHIVDLKASRGITSLLPLVRYLREEKPDVLLAVTELCNLVSIAARMLTRSQTRLALSIMNVPSQYSINVLHQQEKLYPALTRWLYPRADYIIAIAEAIRQDLITNTHIPPDHIKTIFTPVLTPDLYARAEKAVVHPWFDDDIPVILTVARFVPQKDLPTLIRAFALVKQQRPARLMIIGDGQDRPQLERLIAELGLEDDIVLLGFIDNLPYMGKADVFVLSSIFEGLPTVLIEALALSKAIVSTDCPGGAREILDDGKYGQLVPMQDPAMLAEAIITTLNHSPDPQLLRQQARNFEVQYVIQQYMQYMELT